MYGFEAVVFNGKRTARKALDTLEDHAPGLRLDRRRRGRVAQQARLRQNSTAPGPRTTAPSAREPAGEWSLGPCSA